MWKESKVVAGTTGVAGVAGGKTQLVKSRQPLLWSGQKIDRGKIEVERWYENNRASNEEKVLDLMESLKRLRR